VYHVHGQIHLELGEGERTRPQVFVDALDHFAKIVTFLLDPSFGGRLVDLNEQNPQIGLAGLAEWEQRIRSAGVRVNIVDQNDAASPVLLRRYGFKAEIVDVFTLENALLVRFLRSVAEDQNKLVLHVEAVIVVVVEVLGGNSVSREYNIARLS